MPYPSGMGTLLATAFLPQSLKPIPMLLAGHFSVLCCGIEALVAQMFLKKPEAVSRIVELNGMDGKGGPQAGRANVVYPARLRVHQLWQPCSLGTLLHYLPCSMPVDAKDKPFSVPHYRAATVNVFPEHVESLTVNWQNSLAPMLLFFS
jgi:hypothetical protein